VGLGLEQQLRGLEMGGLAMLGFSAFLLN